MNDYDLRVADEEARAEAIAYIYHHRDTLRAAHRGCNSADGYIWRDREAWRRPIGAWVKSRVAAIYSNMPYIGQ